MTMNLKMRRSGSLDSFSDDAEDGDDEVRAACTRREGHGDVGTGATANPLEIFIAF